MKSPLVKLVVQAIEEIKGLDLKVLDVMPLTTITDHMVICTGTSNRHVKSIADNITVQAKAAGFRPLGVEGLDAAEWVLVDLGDVVVHVMQLQARAFYQLEKLWDVPPPDAAPVPKLPKPKKAATGKRAKFARGGKAAKSRKPRPPSRKKRK